MQRLFWRGAVASALLLMGVADGAAASKEKAANPADRFVMRSEKFLGCTEFQASKAGNNEGDFIEYKCVSQFGPPMWMLIQEGTRYSFGFGKTENTPLMAVGDAEGAIEWWGKLEKGKFVPRTVIKRFEFSDFAEPPKLTKQLVVFRLLRNGKSCALAVIEPQAGANEAARKIALSDGKCL